MHFSFWPNLFAMFPPAHGGARCRPLQTHCCFLPDPPRDSHFLRRSLGLLRQVAFAPFNRASSSQTIRSAFSSPYFHPKKIQHQRLTNFFSRFSPHFSSPQRPQTLMDACAPHSPRNVKLNGVQLMTPRHAFLFPGSRSMMDSMTTIGCRQNRACPA